MIHLTKSYKTHLSLVHILVYFFFFCVVILLVWVYFFFFGSLFLLFVLEKFANLLFWFADLVFICPANVKILCLLYAVIRSTTSTIFCQAETRWYEGYIVLNRNTNKISLNSFQLHKIFTRISRWKSILRFQLNLKSISDQIVCDCMRCIYNRNKRFVV